ncbi:putative TIM-barrel fold metal-dependent hydrolase [Pseudomonas oryzihabitans]|uniref:Amidohydrolase family protein n=1 Tax=Pseudomonas flavocrustae TaxID=2991719 RepID=A0ABT6IF50_9PSED|nr:amidohydrolase family protein [Pseudomonas sp. CBMAI 2609]MDH4762971.1 amidohydrolase family protein [Pseudomonas sp. CBMAI 2609]
MSASRSKSITGIDAHAHVFSRDLQLIGARRYSPEYDATLDQYLEHLQAHGLSHGVLVQPSFLGTDNSYLLAALKQAPQQLRGVVVLEPGISRSTLKDMAQLGVVGVRLNLIGKALPDFRDSAWQGFFRDIADLDWHVELHREVRDLPGLIRQLTPFGVKLVIDHLGRPDANAGLDQPGFGELLEAGSKGSIWIKVSGIYRLGGTPQQNIDFARRALPLLEKSVGLHQLVWGSDWPHTQHEQSVDFATVVDQLQALELSAQASAALLVQAPRRLFGF